MNRAQAKRILILGGTQDAISVAAGLTQLPGLEVTTSLAGRTQTPQVPGRVRVGGFGGTAGLSEYLQTHQVSALIDATHPFAARISWNAAAAAMAVGIPHLMVVRPAWEKVEGDRWIEVRDHDAAARSLPESASRVFLTIGRQEISAYAALEHRWFLMRAIESPPAGEPQPRGLWLLARGPFSLPEERALLIGHKIDAIVSKNSGGAATYAKIAAARDLNLPVVMVQRPDRPKVLQIQSATEAVRWVRERLGCDISS
jgi:precorrin-6A/cobalt-precorrin-6A reductase